MTSGRYGRRDFLKRVGIGAGAVAGGGIPGAFARPVAAAPARSRFASTDAQHFGRIFPELAAFAVWEVEATDEWAEWYDQLRRAKGNR